MSSTSCATIDTPHSGLVVRDGSSGDIKKAAEGADAKGERVIARGEHILWCLRAIMYIVSLICFYLICLSDLLLNHSRHRDTPRSTGNATARCRRRVSLTRRDWIHAALKFDAAEDSRWHALHFSQYVDVFRDLNQAGRTLIDARGARDTVRDGRRSDTRRRDARAQAKAGPRRAGGRRLPGPSLRCRRLAG